MDIKTIVPTVLSVGTDLYYTLEEFKALPFYSITNEPTCDDVKPGDKFVIYYGSGPDGPPEVQELKEYPRYFKIFEFSPEPGSEKLHKVQTHFKVLTEEENQEVLGAFEFTKKNSIKTYGEFDLIVIDKIGDDIVNEGAVFYCGVCGHAIGQANDLLKFPMVPQELMGKLRFKSFVKTPFGITHLKCGHTLFSASKEWAFVSLDHYNSQKEITVN